MTRSDVPAGRSRLAATPGTAAGRGHAFGSPIERLHHGFDPCSADRRGRPDAPTE